MKQDNNTNLLLGKIPPQVSDLEKAVLGGMLIDSKSIIEVQEILDFSDFYKTANQNICKAIFEVNKNNSCDTLLVCEWLREHDQLEEVGGAYEITKLTNGIVSTVNIKRYCRIIKEKSILRRLIDFSGNVINEAFDNGADVFELLTQSEQILKGIYFELDEINVTQNSQIAMNVIERFDDRVYCAKNDIINPKEVYTLIPEWDRINGSLFEGLYIIAGRPGMGKGVHMTELICRMGKKYKVGVINGEMTNEQLMIRLGCNLMGIDNYLWKKKPQYVTEEEQQIVKEAMQEVLGLNLFIYDNKYIDKICNRIKMWVEKEGVQCIYADFLTLFKVPDSIGARYTDVQKVNYIVDAFANISKKLRVPIFLYVQMNREILKRHGSKEPNLGDLKQTGNIEEFAYQVSFLHRPEYYDPTAITDEMGESTKGLMYQIIAKHREGDVGRIKHRAVLQCSQLKEWDNVVVPNWNPQDFTQPKKDSEQDTLPF